MAAKDIAKLIAALEAGGAKVKAHGQRWRVEHPTNRALAFLPKGRVESRGLENKIAELRRKGFQV
ncbi:hypothetical protein [Streptomyces sp. TRM68367]|uniref:hypothetical protein n=1 Tax=Streptomyces sp. TRM68367 TaxID=2758415 RepID=UPI00165AF3B1|nr:hypothetical protein [Streptomyces sp. TRM68367]MBC9730711.1 hypothetical protein [Streptomyces sp. TRM68367]